MAQYKACMPIVAPIITEDESGIIYGEMHTLGKMMSVKISPEYEDVKVYGDDQIAEEVNVFKSAGIELGVTHLPTECESVIFGNLVNPETGKITDTEFDDGNYCGFGFIICLKVKGKDIYRLYVIRKSKFTVPNDEFNTKGETISFQTPNISGKAYAPIDGKWRERQEFTTAAEAISALKAYFKSEEETE